MSSSSLFRIVLSGQQMVWQDIIDDAQIVGVLVPVELEPSTQWCFSHGKAVFKAVSGKMICDEYLRSPCDIDDAAVVRIGDADEQ